MHDVIYLDHQATTPVDPRVLDAMLPLFREAYGNPHSAEHALGRAAEAAVEVARGEIAAVIGAEAREIVFTSGATEANNLAILGAGRFRRREQDRDHVVTVATEHKCVLESVRQLGREGMRTTILPVRSDGLLDLDALAAVVDERTALVSVMAANNEIGVVQPLAEIGAIARRAGAWFHVDAAQAFGKIPLDVAACHIDLLSVSAHKVYGPKGIGALFVRRRPRVRLEPLFHGGGQERGLRSGTLPAPLCVGFGVAARIAVEGMAAEAERLAALRGRFVGLMEQRLGPLIWNGTRTARLAGNLNVRIPGVSAAALIEAAPGVAVSTGSACSSAAVEPSYVLRALGLTDAEAAESVRIGFGRFTSEAETAEAARRLAEGAETLRATSAAPAAVSA